MKINRHQWSQWYSQFHNMSQFKLGELFCKDFHVEDPKLMNETNNGIAIAYIIKNYVNFST
jgi:hypothetical protein